MIADGVLSDPAPEAIFAFHTAPLEVGQVGYVEGLGLPGFDIVTVRVSGGEDPGRRRFHLGKRRQPARLPRLGRIRRPWSDQSVR